MIKEINSKIMRYLLTWKNKSWTVLTPGEGIREKRLLYPIDGSVNLNTFVEGNLSLSTKILIVYIL